MISDNFLYFLVVVAVFFGFGDSESLRRTDFLEAVLTGLAGVLGDEWSGVEGEGGGEGIRIAARTEEMLLAESSTDVYESCMLS